MCDGDPDVAYDRPIIYSFSDLCIKAPPREVRGNPFIPWDTIASCCARGIMITRNEGGDETDLGSLVDCTRARFDREVGTIHETQSGKTE